MEVGSWSSSSCGGGSSAGPRRSLRRSKAVEDSGYDTLTPTTFERLGSMRIDDDEEEGKDEEGDDDDGVEVDSMASSSLLEAPHSSSFCSQWSPIFREERTGGAGPQRIKDERKARRQTFRRARALHVKIGTPEKNRLLYPRLKSVTPPERRPPSRQTKPVATRTLNLGEYRAGAPVDFLRLLRGQEPILRRLFAHLSDEDVYHASRVSRAWRLACRDDAGVERRRRRFAELLECDKENAREGGGGECREEIKRKKAVAESAPHKLTRALSDAQNRRNVAQAGANSVQAIQRSPPVSPRSRNHHKFVKAASLGANLLGCVTCGNPATVRGQWAKCQSAGCGLAFCARCRFDRRHCEKNGCKTLEPTSPSARRGDSPCAKGVTKRGRPVRKSFKRLLKFDC